MNANNIFSFKRFGKYFVSDFKNATANFGLSLLATPFIVLGMFFIVCLLTNFVSGMEWNGPVAGIRIFGLVISLAITCIVMPTKTYGKITEKQYGSFWLMIPASSLEKSISMILISSIIAPLATIVLYLAVDAVLCALDPSCGSNIISLIIKLGTEGIDTVRNLLVGIDEVPESVATFVTTMMNPWMYVGEFMGLVLPFLFGAVFFKKNKVVYTILMLAAIGMATSFMVSPIMMNYMSDIITTNDPSVVFEHPLFKNLHIINLVSNLVTDLIFMVLIFIRVKTIKH